MLKKQQEEINVTSPSPRTLPDLPEVPDLPDVSVKPNQVKKRKEPPTSIAAIRTRMLKGFDRLKDTAPKHEEKPLINSDGIVGTNKDLGGLNSVNKANLHPIKAEIEKIGDKEQSHIGKRNVLVDYFNRMILNQTYEFKVRISKYELEKQKKSQNILSGEQRTQVKEEVAITDQNPIEIELNMPGCLVTPILQYVSPAIESAVVSFFITPVARFKHLDARLKIGQG